VFSPNHSAWSEPVDHWKYEYVAEHPIGSFHIQPICWRLGVPLLVRILPFSMYRNFEVVGISAFALCGLMVYLWILAIPRPRTDAVLGVMMFYAMGAAVKLVLWTAEGPDAASYFFILLALYAIYKENDWLCAAALAIGMFTKETLVIVIPLHYTLKAAQLIDFRRALRTMLVGAPAIAVYIGLRLAIPAWNDNDAYVQSLPFRYTQVSAGMVKYDLATAFRGTMQVYRSMPPIDLLRLFTWGSLGIFLFLPLFAPKENRVLLLRWTPYWLGVCATLLIALNADRRVGSLFPVLIVMGLAG